MNFIRNQEIEFISPNNRIVRRGRFAYRSGSTYCVYPYPFVDNYPIKFSLELPEFIVDIFKFESETVEVKICPIFVYPTHFEYINEEACLI